VARLGVTGSGIAPAMGHHQLFADLDRYGAPPPVLGFGISSAEHVAQAVASGASGVISGSALVERATLSDGVEQVQAFCVAMKQATRRA
jgi:tryptophan synthase alpha chain